MTTQVAILYPVFVQVALTFGLGLWLGAARVRSVRSREARLSREVNRKTEWPEPVARLGACYSNQFEGPVLFYAVCTLALVTAKVSPLLLVFAWIYALSRLAHAYIFITTNDITKRFGAFVVGSLALLFFWIIFAIRIVFEGA